jgi:hypothetical protein
MGRGFLNSVRNAEPTVLGRYLRQNLKNTTERLSSIVVQMDVRGFSGLRHWRDIDHSLGMLQNYFPNLFNAIIIYKL